MKYFSHYELLNSDAARRSGVANMYQDVEHLVNLESLVDDVLDPLRELFGKPILVNSAYRTVVVNKLVGGADNSLHCSGMAVDITAAYSADNLHLANLIQTIFDFDQLIVYKDKSGYVRWLHLSYTRYGVNRHEVIFKRV